MKKYDHRIVDIHTHVLPGVDDGSRSIDETIRLLSIAEADGTTDIIATPHFKMDRKRPSVELLQSRLKEVRAAAKDKGINVKVHLGNEIMFFSDIVSEVSQGRALTMNGTNFVLIEFFPRESYMRIRGAVESLFSAGYIPVIAHVERYECLVDNYDRVRELVEMGARLQINVRSAFLKEGFYMSKAVWYFLKNEWIDYVGTDAHDSKERTTAIAKFVKKAYKKLDEYYVEGILYRNAERDFEL